MAINIDLTAPVSQYLTNYLKDQQCSQEDEIVEDSEYMAFFLIRVNYIVSKKFIQYVLFDFQIHLSNAN